MYRFFCGDRAWSMATEFSEHLAPKGKQTEELCSCMPNTLAWTISPWNGRIFKKNRMRDTSSGALRACRLQPHELVGSKYRTQYPPSEAAGPVHPENSSSLSCTRQAPSTPRAAPSKFQPVGGWARSRGRKERRVLLNRFVVW